MPFIYSSLTNGYSYTNWHPDPQPGQPREIIAHEDGFKEQIHIKGGANLANTQLITPYGVRTEVTERQLEVLLRNSTFLRHQRQGFIVVRNDKADPDEVARDHMEPRDRSAPYTPKSEIFNKDDPEAVKPIEGLGDKIRGAVRRAVG